MRPNELRALALKVYSRLMPLRLLWVNENAWEDELEELSAGCQLSGASPRTGAPAARVPARP